MHRTGPKRRLKSLSQNIVNMRTDDRKLDHMSDYDINLMIEKLDRNIAMAEEDISQMTLEIRAARDELDFRSQSQSPQDSWNEYLKNVREGRED